MAYLAIYGGGSGIRTHGGLAPTAVFKSDFRDSLQYLATHYDNKFNSLPPQVFCAGLPNVASIRAQVSHSCPIRDISGQLV